MSSSLPPPFLPFSPSDSLDTQSTPDPSSPSSPLTSIPDYPSIPIHSDPSSIRSFLSRELSTPVLDALYPHLWTVAARESSRIDALHVQLIKGRRITVAEDPQLHLVWTTGNVYVKPLPAFLLNYHFWRDYLARKPRGISHAELVRSAPKANGRDGGGNGGGSKGLRGDRAEGAMTWEKRNGNVAAADAVAEEGEGEGAEAAYVEPPDDEYFSAQAIGFVRSYVWLLRSPSDLRVAHEHGLVPATISWSAWANFAATFARNTESTEILRWRFRYGQLRLRRLDWAVTLFRGRGLNGSIWWYYRAYSTIDMWLKDVFGVLALAYAFASILLAAMQVVLQAGTVADGGKMTIFESISAANVLGGFGLALISGTVLSLIFIWIVSFVLFARQFAWGFGHR